jgi:hypothetical protein
MFAIRAASWKMENMAFGFRIIGNQTEKNKSLCYNVERMAQADDQFF